MRAIAPLLTLLVAVLLQACVTVPVSERSDSRQPAAAAVLEYRVIRDDVDSETVIAMLAYSSSAINSMSSVTPAAVSRYLSTYCDSMSSGQQVSANYAVVPSRVEVEWFRAAATRWLMSARTLSGSGLQASYRGFAATVISDISSMEYVR